MASPTSMRREYRLSHVRAVALHGRVPDRTGKLSLEVTRWDRITRVVRLAAMKP
jgi:hypothetical protein